MSQDHKDMICGRLERYKGEARETHSSCQEEN